MKWFSKNKKENQIPSTADMTPLQAVTHLCACIQLSDGDANFEEKKAWLNGVSKLFPSFSEERADKFLNEAHVYINNSNQEDLIAHTKKVLVRIKEVFNTDQISGLEPILKNLVEADGIVMTSEVEIVDLVENYLSINLNINKNL
tara:strand:+ start:102 stop:536 length:435 start_codon:yes stop_codon:yes gene_type:complete